MNCRSSFVDLLLSFLGVEEFVIRFFDLDLECQVSGLHYFGTAGRMFGFRRHELEEYWGGYAFYMVQTIFRLFSADKNARL